MDDLQLHMETAQRNHAEATRIHQEFMQQAIEQRRHAQNITTNEAEMEKLEKEFQNWMEYIRNKKL